MLNAGLADEVRDLLERFGPDVRPMAAVGYKQMRDHLLAPQRCNVPDVCETITRATLLYARRQRTWFASDPNFTLRCDPQNARQPELLGRLQAHMQDRPRSLSNT